MQGIIEGAFVVTVVRVGVVEWASKPGREKQC